jgi:hypothetical protein
MKIPSTNIFKSQITKHKYQTNHNDPNTKFQTNDRSIFVPNGIITGRVSFAKRFAPIAVNILVIGY